MGSWQLVLTLGFNLYSSFMESVFGARIGKFPARSTEVTRWRCYGAFIVSLSLTADSLLGSTWDLALSLPALCVFGPQRKAPGYSGGQFPTLCILYLDLSKLLSLNYTGIRGAPDLVRKWRDHIRAKKELTLEEIHLGTSLKGGISKGSARIEIFFCWWDFRTVQCDISVGLSKWISI